MGLKVISELDCPGWLAVPEQLQSKINTKMGKGREIIKSYRFQVL